MKLFKDRLAALLFNLIYYHKYDISIKNAVKDISQCYYYLMQELEIKMRKSEVISGLVSEVLKSKLDTWKDKVIKNHQYKKIIKMIKKCSRNKDLKKNLNKLNFKQHFFKKQKKQVLSSYFMHPGNLFKKRIQHLNFLTIMIVEEDEARYKDYIDFEWNSIEVIQGFFLACYSDTGFKQRLAQTLLKYFDSYDQEFEDLEFSVFSSSETMQALLAKPQVSMAALSCLSIVNLFETGNLPDIESLIEMLTMYKNFIEKIWCSRLTNPKNTYNLVKSGNLKCIMEVSLVLEVAVNLQFDVIDEHREEDEESELDSFFETLSNFIFDIMVGCNNMDAGDREEMLIKIITDSMLCILNVEKVFKNSKHKNKDKIYKELRFCGLMYIFSVAFYNLFCVKVKKPICVLNEDEEIKSKQVLFKKIIKKFDKKDTREFVRVLISRVVFNEGRRTGIYRKHYNVNVDENQYFIKEWMIAATKIFSLVYNTFEDEYFRIFDQYLLDMKGSEFFDQLVNLSVTIFCSRNVFDFLFIGIGLGSDMEVEEEVKELRFNSVLQHCAHLKEIARISLFVQGQMKIKDFEEVINYPFEEDCGTLGSKLKEHLLTQVSVQDEKGFCKLLKPDDKPKLLRSLFLLKPNASVNIESKLIETKQQALIETGKDFLHLENGKSVDKLIDICVRMGTILTKLEINQESKNKKDIKLRNEHGKIIRGIQMTNELAGFLKQNQEKMIEILSLNESTLNIVKDDEEKEKKKQKMKKKGKKLMAKIKKKGKKKMAKIKDLKTKAKEEKKEEETHNYGKCLICHEDMTESSKICTLVKRHKYDVYEILKDQKKKELLGDKFHYKKIHNKAQSKNPALDDFEHHFPEETMIYSTCGHEYHVSCLLKAQLEKEDAFDFSFFKCSFCHTPSDNYFLSRKINPGDFEPSDVSHILKELKGASDSTKVATETVKNCILTCVKLKDVWDKELFVRRVLPCSQQVIKYLFVLKEKGVQEAKEFLEISKENLKQPKFEVVLSGKKENTKELLQVDCHVDMAEFVIWKFFVAVFEKEEVDKVNLLQIFNEIFYELLGVFTIIKHFQQLILNEESLETDLPELEKLENILAPYEEIEHLMKIIIFSEHYTKETETTYIGTQ